jgi:hypothetical protein
MSPILYENSCQPLTNIQPCPLIPRLMLVTMTTFYSTKIQHHDLFARYVQLVQYKSPPSGHSLIFFFSQAAQQLQVRLNTQQDLSQNLQHKFDNISNTAPDGNTATDGDNEDNDSTSPARKRHQREDNLDPDDRPSVEEAEAEEVKGLGRQFLILHGPWLRRKELIFQVELDEDYDENKRFKDTNTLVQGQLHEIRGLLLEKYLGDAFTKKWLSKSVSNVHFLYECTNCSISLLRE